MKTFTEFFNESESPMGDVAKIVSEVVKKYRPSSLEYVRTDGNKDEFVLVFVTDKGYVVDGFDENSFVDNHEKHRLFEQLEDDICIPCAKELKKKITNAVRKYPVETFIKDYSDVAYGKSITVSDKNVASSTLCFIDIIPSIYSPKLKNWKLDKNNLVHPCILVSFNGNIKSTKAIPFLKKPL